MSQNESLATPRHLRRRDGSTIAYHHSEGKTPGVVFMGGFMSDMTGTKATTIERHCRHVGRAFVRFDYFGHGISDGRFEDGTIGRWRDDALAVLDEVTVGPQILVGSSLGGWIALLVALVRPERCHGLIGLAAAPDFTEALYNSVFDEKARSRIEHDGVVELPSDYGAAPYPIAWNLIVEAREHLLLDRAIPIRCPVRLFQGMQDADVSWPQALRIAERIEGENLVLTLLKDGDHRLSRDQDLARICAEIEALAES